MLNCLRNYLKKVSIVAITAGIAFTSAYSANETYVKNVLPDGAVKINKAVTPMPLNTHLKSNVILRDTKFKIVDSLANAYSCYLTNVNRSYAYSPEDNSYIFLKRGYNENLSVKNNKNNLFVIKSIDGGANWSAPSLVYDYSENQNMGARYPSVASVKYENSMGIAYTTPLIKSTGSDWAGIAAGMWTEGGLRNFMQREQFELNGVSFDYSTNSRVVTIPNDKKLIMIEVMPINPTENTNYAESNNILLRKTEDFTDTYVGVPEQWLSSKFTTPTAAGRFNEVVDFLKGPSNSLYLAVYGNFASATQQKSRPAFSVSNDLGTTWSEFNILPQEVMTSFASDNDCYADSVYFNWDSKSFTVLGNGDCSFLMSAIMKKLDATTYEAYVVEVSYSKANAKWTMNNLATVDGYFTYSDVLNSTTQARENPADYELQIAKTQDGKTLVAKWVDIMGYDTTQTPARLINDVFMSYKSSTTNKWSKPVNVTKNDELDKSTLIPDVVPNELKKIPLMKLITITSPDLTDAEVYTKQFEAQTPQYLVANQVDLLADGVSDEPEPCDCKELAIQKINPNPAISQNEVSVSFYMPQKGLIDINLYDYNGKLVSDLKEFDKEYEALSNTIHLNFANINGLSLTSGGYYVSIQAFGQKVTRLLNIVK